MSAALSPLDVEMPSASVTVVNTPVEPAVAIHEAVALPSADVEMTVASPTNDDTLEHSVKEDVQTLLPVGKAIEVPAPRPVDPVKVELIKELQTAVDDSFSSACTFTPAVLSGSLRAKIPKGRFYTTLNGALELSQGFRESVAGVTFDTRQEYEPLNVGVLHSILSQLPCLDNVQLMDMDLGGDDVPRPERAPLPTNLSSLTIDDTRVLHTRPELFAQVLHIYSGVTALYFNMHSRPVGPNPISLYSDRAMDKNAADYKLVVKKLHIGAAADVGDQDYIFDTFARELDVRELEELVVDALNPRSLNRFGALLQQCTNLKRLELSMGWFGPANPDAYFEGLALPSLASLEHLKEISLTGISLPLGGQRILTTHNCECFIKIVAALGTIPVRCLSKVVLHIDTVNTSQITCDADEVHESAQMHWTVEEVCAAMKSLPWNSLGETIAKHAASLQEIHFNTRYGHEFERQADECVLLAMPQSVREVAKFGALEKRLGEIPRQLTLDVEFGELRLDADDEDALYV